MFTIRLNKLIFFAHHGVHDEETVVGNEFEVSIELTFLEKGKIETLDDTINYVEVYDVVKRHFGVPVKLLETLAQNIAADIYEHEKNILSINITIDKLNPPIINFIGSVGIKYSKSY